MDISMTLPTMLAHGRAEILAWCTPVALKNAIDNADAAGADEFFLVPTTADPAELVRTRAALGL